MRSGKGHNCIFEAKCCSGCFGSVGMVKGPVVVFFIYLLLYSGLWGEPLVRPNLQVVESETGHFDLTLMVPAVEGEYLEIVPILPNRFRPKVKPSIYKDVDVLNLSWSIKAEAAALPGQTFGLEGLSGKAEKGLFILSTLDGRKVKAVLSPSQPTMVVPLPLSKTEFAKSVIGQTLRRVLKQGGLWLMLIWLTCSKWAVRLKVKVGLTAAIFFVTYLTLRLTTPAGGLTASEFVVARGITATVAVLILILTVPMARFLHKLVNERTRRFLWLCSSTLMIVWLTSVITVEFKQNGVCWASWLKESWNGLYAPFATDWAVAKLRIPLFSVCILTGLVSALFKSGALRRKLGVTAILLVLSIFMLPYGVVKVPVTFVNIAAPTAVEARTIITPVLLESYKALSLHDESESYDRLARKVSKRLLPELYLDGRRRMIKDIPEGASVEVLELQLKHVDEVDGLEGTPVYSCRWIVVANVTHWSHTHKRLNMYEGNLHLVLEDQQWKLDEIDLRSEKREVVTESFFNQ